MRESLAFLAMAAGIACVGGAAMGDVTLIGGSTNNGWLDQTYAQEIVPGFFLPKPAVWQNVGTRAISGAYEDEMDSEPWAGPAPTPVTTGASGLPVPDGVGVGEGDAAVFFKPFTGNSSDGATTAHLYQDLPGTPGLKYVMTGWAGGEANAMMTDAQFAIDFLDGSNVFIGGTQLSLLPSLLVPNGQPFNYKQYSLESVAPAGTVTVRTRISMVGGLSNQSGGGQAFVVDDFTLTAVPEPATVGLLVGGMGAMLVRRRR